MKYNELLILDFFNNTIYNKAVNLSDKVIISTLGVLLKYKKKLFYIFIKERVINY